MRSRWAGLVLVVVLALTVYLRTVAPTITWAHHGADGGDLISAVATQGIPHPTGYPTYLLMGRLFLLLPWGDLAHRLNVMSAVLGALTSGLLYLVVLLTFRLFDNGGVSSRGPLVAAASALVFAFSPLFWSQALVSEVYTLNAFFVALALALVLRWIEAGQPICLSAGALAFGLGLGNHLTFALLAPSLAALLLLESRELLNPRLRVIAIVAALLLGLSVYLILPLRASRHPPINWADPRTVDRFLWLVSGRLYWGYAFGLPARHIGSRLSAWAGLLVRQFGWWGLSLALVGFWTLWDRARSLVIFSLVTLSTYSAYAITYDTSDSYVYLIPTFLIIGIWLAWGLAYALSELQRQAGPGALWPARALPHLVLLVPLLSLLSNFSSMDASAAHQARDYGLAVLGAVEPSAIVITQTDEHSFALGYFRYAEERRPDVALLDSDLLHHVWYRQHLLRIHPGVMIDGQGMQPGRGGDRCAPSALLNTVDLNWQRRPTYLTDPGVEIWSCYVLSREGPIYRVTGYRSG